MPYMQAGVNHHGVEKTKEQYTARIAYEDINGKNRGHIVIHAPTFEAFNDVAADIPGVADITTKMGGAGHRDAENEGFTATLTCHDQNGELYNVVFQRGSVRLNSYSDDAIRNRVETWADGVAALG
jgi:hypothetical protein